MARNQIENVDIKKGAGLLIHPMMISSLYVILQMIQIEMSYNAVFAFKVLSVEVRDLLFSLHATILFASRAQSHGTKTNKEEMQSF